MLRLSMCGAVSLLLFCYVLERFVEKSSFYRNTGKYEALVVKK
jgi:hypothetical protein